MSKNKGEMKEKAKKAPKRMKSAGDKIKTLHRKGNPARAKIFVKAVPAIPIPADKKNSAKMADFDVIHRDKHGNAILWKGPNDIVVRKPEHDAIHRDRVNMMAAIAG